MSRSGDGDVLSTAECKRQLDFDTPCGAANSEETCWLCGDLTPWNRVMRELAFELVEPSPGTLLLRAVTVAEKDQEPTSVAREASLLVSWLLCHHPCIQQLQVTCAIPENDAPAVEPSYPIHICAPSSMSARRSLRSLRITESPDALLHLRDLDAVVDLEMVFVDAAESSLRLPSQVKALLERNRSTLTRLSIRRHNRHGLYGNALESLVACEFLTPESPDDERRMLETDAISTVMRMSAALKEATAQPVLPKEASAIAKTLATDLTVTKLSLYVEAHGSLEELFRGIEVNTNLKEVFLHSSIFIDNTCMQAVASVLEKSCLRILYLGTVVLNDCGGLGPWLEALSKNSTLAYLRMHCGKLPTSEISALCKVLRVNKTLKKLVLSGITASDEEKISLTRQILVDGCYDRVRLGPWPELGLQDLSALLPSHHKSPEHLWLPDIDQLSRNTVRDLFNALASSKRVKHLIVEVKRKPDAGVAALCKALKMNRSVSYLHIDIGNERSARRILLALTVNAAITKLDITLRVPAVEETMAVFSSMLQRNDSLTTVSVCLYVRHHSRFMEAIAEGLSRNKVVVEFEIWASGAEYVPFAILEAVRRNRCALNRALEFVLQTREDRHSAECFDRFYGRPCVLTHLTEFTGVPEVEARLEVVAAKHRLQDRYLVLTGVVRHSIVCWPADVTQIDALNEDCWHAIARYLRISDVCIA